MNPIQKTRFYLGLSLVARAISIAAYSIGTIVGLFGIGVFFFAHSIFDPVLVWAPVLMIVAGFAEGWCARTLVKQYGLST